MTETKTKSPYTIDDDGTITIQEDCALGSAGDVREFRATHGGIYEIFEGRPGTMGNQICAGLGLAGATLMALDTDEMVRVLRRECDRLV